MRPAARQTRGLQAYNSCRTLQRRRFRNQTLRQGRESGNPQIAQRQKPSALTSAAVNPAALTSAVVKPAALRDDRSSPSAAVRPSAASTAFTASRLRIMNKPGVRAAEDAMSHREEEAPPALAASMMQTQRWRVTSSAAARHTSLAACNAHTRPCS
jgi:hypothetical protein